MGVKFIRKNGRVIPINDSRAPAIAKPKTAAIGAAQVAAGLTVGVAGGTATAEMVRRASSQVSKSRTIFKVNRAYLATVGADQLAFPGIGKTAKQAKEKMREAAKAGAIAKKFFRARNPLLAGAALASGALLTAGVLNIEKGVKGKKAEISATKIGVLEGTGTALTIAAYYKKLPVRGLGKIATNVIGRMRGKTSGIYKADWWK